MIDRRQFLTLGATVGLTGCVGINPLDPLGPPTIRNDGSPATPEDEDHDWPIELDRDTAPEFTGEYPPGIEATDDGDDIKMADPKTFLAFHDSAAYEDRYIESSSTFTHTLFTKDGEQPDETDEYSYRSCGDAHENRCYSKAATGGELYSMNGAEWIRGPDGSVTHEADPVVNPIRRSVGGPQPYLFLAVKWTNGARNPDGTFTLEGYNFYNDQPSAFRDATMDINRMEGGQMTLDERGRIINWEIDMKTVRLWNDEPSLFASTMTNVIRYGDDADVSTLPESHPEWTSA